MLGILSVEWAIGDILEECRFLLQTQLMFLKREKTPLQTNSTKMSEATTTDIPEERITHDHSEADPQTVRPI